MTDEYRAPQPYDDGTRHDDGADTPAAEQSKAADEQQRVFAMPAGDEASAPDAVETDAAGDAAASAAQQASEQSAAATAQHGFENAPPPQDERLIEAVQRSRNLPIDGDYEVAAAEADDGEAVPASAPQAQDATATAAGSEPQQAAAVEDIAEPQQTPASGATEQLEQDAAHETVAADDSEAAHPSDDETFAPLGISMTEGLLVEPEKPSNRGFAVLMSVFATVVFAVGYAVAFTLARKLFTRDLDIFTGLMEMVGLLQFYLPVAVFFVVFLFWSLLANRARWWGYIVASQLLAVLVAAACYAALGLNAVLDDKPFTAEVFLEALRDYVHLPGALLAALVAIPVVTWFGGISAMRAAKLTREYEHELAEYDRRVEFEREQARQHLETPVVE